MTPTAAQLLRQEIRELSRQLRQRERALALLEEEEGGTSNGAVDWRQHEAVIDTHAKLIRYLANQPNRTLEGSSQVEIAGALGANPTATGRAITLAHERGDVSIKGKRRPIITLLNRGAGRATQVEPGVGVSEGRKNDGGPQ